jgi:hypothetical protein
VAWLGDFNRSYRTRKEIATSPTDLKKTGGEVAYSPEQKKEYAGEKIRDS